MSVDLEILATPLDDINFCRFTLGTDKLALKEIEFNNVPSEDFFIKDIFETGVISQVILDQNYIICKKSTDQSWQIIGKTIGNILRINYKQNKLVVPSKYLGNDYTEDKVRVNENKSFLSSDLGRRIQEVIELQIQPSLGAHGGSVRLVDFKAGELLVAFSGGCQGCSQASVTVRDGIERIISAKFPEVKSIVDTTNHSMGDNPYFK